MKKSLLHPFGVREATRADVADTSIKLVIGHFVRSKKGEGSAEALPSTPPRPNPSPALAHTAWSARSARSRSSRLESPRCALRSTGALGRVVDDKRIAVQF